MVIVHFLCIAVGASIPLLIEKVKGKTLDDNFSLSTLSKIAGMLLVYYGVGIIYYKFEEPNILPYLFANVLLTISFIVAVTKYSLLKNDLKRIVVLPRFIFGSKYHVLILSFFFFMSFSSYLAVHLHPEKIQSDYWHFIMIKALNENHWFSIILFLAGTFAIIGEELVFRYYAINTLKQKFNKGLVILISSLIWTMLHWDVAFVIFLLGLLLGYLYYETESLSLCVVLHLIFNLVALSGPFYLIYKGHGVLSFSSYQYIMLLFAFQMLLYHSADLVFKKTVHIAPQKNF